MTAFTSGPIVAGRHPSGTVARHGAVSLGGTVFRGGKAARHGIVVFVGIALVGVMLVGAGCSRTQTPKMPLTPAAPDPVAEAKSLLESYGTGLPLGSESANYEDLVKRVTAVDAAKGEKLKAFADEALKKGRIDAAKAKKLAAEL